MGFDNFTPHHKSPKIVKKLRKRVRSRSKKWRPATPEELTHLEYVKSFPCICCNKPPISEANHLTEGKRLGHYFTYPLCKSCHTDGKLSLRKDKKRFISTYGTEWNLLYKFWDMINFNMKLVEDQWPKTKPLMQS